MELILEILAAGGIGVLFFFAVMGVNCPCHRRERAKETALIRGHINTLQRATGALKAAVSASRTGVQSQVPGVKSSVGNKTKTTN